MTQISPGLWSPMVSMSANVAVRDRQHAELEGDADVLQHRAAQERDLAAARDGGVGELLDAVDVAREAGDDDPPTPLRQEDPAQGLADAALAAGVAGQLRVRRVREQQADAFGGGDLADPGQVRAAPVDGVQVELEVAAVEHDALGGVEGEGEAVRHRVRHRDELDVERPDPAPLAVAHRHERGLLAEPCLVQAVAGEPERQRRAVDRGVDVAQQVGERARRGPRARG